MRADSAVSAIIVSYFTGPLLERSIRSLRRQDAIKEIILVDNGNPPGAVEAAIAKSDGPPIRVLSGHGNIGFAAACNKGANAAKCALLLFLNPDALMPDGGLNQLINASDALARPWLLGAKLIDPDGAEQQGSRRGVLSPKTAFVEAAKLYKIWPNTARFNLHTTPPPDTLSPVDTLSGAILFTRQEDYLAIGGMDEAYFLHVEDVDFCHRFKAAGGNIYFEPRVEITHFKSSSRADRLKVEAQKTASLALYFKNHYTKSYSSIGVFAIKICLWCLYGLSALMTLAKRLLRLVKLRRDKGKRAVERARSANERRNLR